MTEDRKNELAAICRLEIRRTVTLIRMGINDREREVANVIDAEFWSMLARIREKPTSESDLPLLRELVLTELWPMKRDAERHQKVIATVADPLRDTALGKRIDDDTWAMRGRTQELLIEFAGVIEDVVNAAVVKEEYLDDYIGKEIDGWRTTAVVPVSDRDREFLHGYLKDLIRAEYERVKGK